MRSTRVFCFLFLSFLSRVYSTKIISLLVKSAVLSLDNVTSTCFVLMRRPLMLDKTDFGYAL